MTVATSAAAARAGGAAIALAAHGLDGTPFEPPIEPLTDARWAGLRPRVDADRLWFLLGDAVAGAWAATDEQIAEATEDEERAATQVLALDRHLVELAERFAAADVACRVLKGPAHAHGLWARGELRFYGDIDLVVPGASFDRAVAMIEEAVGGRRHRPDARAGFTARVGKGTTFTLPDGVEVDLHRTLADGPFGAAIRTGDLFATGDEVPLGSHRVPTLARPEMFVHACLHVAATGGGRDLVPLRDVAEGIDRLSAAEWDTAIDRSDRWGCTAVVAGAVRSAAATFRLGDAVDPDPAAGTDAGRRRAGRLAWARDHRATRRERTWLLVSHGSFPGRALAETACMGSALPTWGDRATFTRGVVFNDHREPWPRRLSRIARR